MSTDTGAYRPWSEDPAALDRLAAQLRADGLRAEDRVGVMLGRTVDAIVAIVGVCKAGAAFLYLDPAGASFRASVERLSDWNGTSDEAPSRA